jgi:hypothetical protein
MTELILRIWIALILLKSKSNNAVQEMESPEMVWRIGICLRPTFTDMHVF